MQKNLSQAKQQEWPVVSSTLSGDAIARAAEALYPVGNVIACHLARRGFNHVYELLLQDGRRCVARLSSHRPRGAPNTAYEAALLAHLKAAGARVAAPWRTRAGASSSPLQVAEGTRNLMVFDFLLGEPPGKVLADIEAMGQGLAQLHRLSQSYQGPGSLYRLELPHLLHKPLQWLLAAPTMDAALQDISMPSACLYLCGTYGCWASALTASTSGDRRRCRKLGCASRSSCCQRGRRCQRLRRAINGLQQDA